MKDKSMHRITFPMLMLGLTTAKPKNRWLQFSLRTLLILTILFCIFFSLYSWFALSMRSAKRQEKAMHALQLLGMGVNFDYEFNIRNGGYYQIPNAKLPEPVWLRALLGDDYFRLLGDDFFRTIIFVEFDGTKVTDTDLKHLEGLPHIRSLGLSKTQITDAGLENLEGLNQLLWLRLQNTQITDAGLEHLRNLTRLQNVDLRGTKVTENGLQKLKQELPHCLVESDHDK
jgi:Leucine Rich repeat